MSTAIATPTNAASKSKTKRFNAPKTQAELKAELATPEPKVLEGEIVNRFDYAEIADAEARAELQGIAKTIHLHIRQEKEARYQIGKALNAAKKVKGFGLFDRWVAVEFPTLEKRTYNHYMALAREFDEATYEQVSYLPLTTQYTLAEGKGTKKVRAKVVADAQKGKPVAKSEVQRLIADAKKATAKSKPVPQPEPANDATGAEDRIDASRSAVALLREKLDEDFPQFVAWFHDAGEAFTGALMAVAKEVA